MVDRKTRSRGACGNCKKRKRRCDQTRPSCLACQRRRILCEGYELKLQWGCGVASRGRLAGSTLPTLDAGADYSSQSTTSGSLDEAVIPCVEYSIAEDSSLYLECSTQPSGSSENYLDQSLDTSGDITVDNYGLKDELIGRFFEGGIYSLFATSTGDSFKNSLRRASMQSPALFSLCRTYQLVSEQPETEEANLQFRKAVGLFQDELEWRNGVIDGGTLCAGLILCTLSNIQNLPWTNQLHCMAELYCTHARLGPFAPIPDAFTHHCLEVIGVMDLQCLVFGRNTPHIGFWKRLREAESASRNGLMGGVETLTGVPRSLLDILAYSDHESAQHDLWNWYGEVGDSLQAQLWDTWRYAGIIYRRRQALRNQDNGGGVTEENLAKGIPSTKDLLWRMIAGLDILRLGLEHPASKDLLYGNSTFWPYLIARCEFEFLRSNLEWKTLLDKLFGMLVSGDKPRHVLVAQNMIQKAWERGDVSFDLDEAALSRQIELVAF